MRLWSLHPKYLDTKGLLAVWREALLAQHVLLGKTKGYLNHPQLIRFKEQADPVKYVNAYLTIIWEEAVRRGYTFDRAKIGEVVVDKTIRVTDSQMQYEWEHLVRKLQVRDPAHLERIMQDEYIAPHPLFEVVEGPIAIWEKVG